MSHPIETKLLVTEGVSVPAAYLNEKRLQEQRYGKLARYQVHNFALILIVGILLSQLFGVKKALYANAEALKHFRPIVVRENELGQTFLVTNQKLNFTHDERSIRSALQFWTMYHMGRMKATVKEFYNFSFLWMTEDYGASIKHNDEQTGWMKKFLKDASQEQYEVIVKNVILKSVEEKDGAPLSGTADIYAYRKYYSVDGIEQPHKASDDFLVHAKWAAAADVPNDIQGFNPLGIAVTHYQIFNSLE
jgi:type IV secretory pathway TrbF-like protein